MGPDMSRWLVNAGKAISVAVGERRGLVWLRAQVDSACFEGMNARERAFLRKAAEAAYRRCKLAMQGTHTVREAALFLTRESVISPLEKAANAMDRRLQVKAKAQLSAEAVRRGREGYAVRPDPSAGGRASEPYYTGVPCVFYAISTHQKPRCEHKDLQGTVVYDERYASVLTKAGFWYMVADVRKTILGQGMMSVREAMSAPHYVASAPFCRHRFYPLDTREVLSGVAETTIRDGAHRSLTDAQRYREKKRRRAEITSRVSRLAVR